MKIHKVSKSAIYLRTEKKIKDTFGTLEENNITPWAFFHLADGLYILSPSICFIFFIFNYSLIHYPKTFDNFLKFLI
jgi:hypothetical protein